MINFENIAEYGHNGLNSQKRFGPEEVPDDDEEEALQSPIDDVQNDLINMQKQEYLRQRKAVSSLQNRRDSDEVDDDECSDGELDEKLQAVRKSSQGGGKPKEIQS